MTNDENCGPFPISGNPGSLDKRIGKLVDAIDMVLSLDKEPVLLCDKCPFKGNDEACAELRKSYDACEKYQPPKPPAAAV